MFPSISRALPNTQVTTSFRATTSLVLVLPVQDANGNPFNVTINNGAVQTGQVPGGSNTTWTVSAAAGDLVTAIVTSPFNNLEHAFFEYTADGVYQNFAVVCKSLSTIKVIPADARKRWYDYSYTTSPAYSLRQSNGVITTPVIYTGKGPITINSHVVMNPVTKSVYFYDSGTGIQISVIAFPSPPIDYQVLTAYNKIIVLTQAGSWYEVDMASVVTPLPALDSTARCLGYSDVTSTMWIGGATVCWVYTPGPAGGMQSIGTCAVTEQIVGIAPLPNLATSAIAVSANSNAYILDTVTGSSPLSPIPSTAIGQPIAFGNYVYIPDGNNSQLLAYNYNTAMFDLAVPTTDYSPKYTLVRNNNLYITSNDSPDVLVFDSGMNMTKLIFRDIVTLVSVSGSTAVASHFLNSRKTTSSPSFTRIVDVTFDNRSGPITHIGSNSVKIITVGYQIVTGYTAGSTVLWVSGVKTDSAGVRGYEIIDGSTVNISYRVTSPGTSQVAAVIGDSAFDYQVTAFVEAYYPRYIDFLIGDSNNPSYTQTITMPNKMTPATMAIEYGDLKLNGIAYNGSTKVVANDVITITITLGNPYGYGKGMLPIFSLGARQFAIPISADPVPVVTTVISDNNLSPNTALSKTQTITGNVSLYDFILPDYYNVKIFKRMTSYSIPGVPPIVSNVDVSSNYYQPFGSGDILVVDYNSSVKLYDTEVVYILGPINYKFTANNRLPFLINYLDYGTLSNPYTRDFEPLRSGFGNSIMGASGAITYVPETAHATDMQVVTANVKIVGYITTLGNAVLTLSGGDAKFIVNGDSVIGSTVSIANPIGNTDVITNAVVVYNGDQVAIGRNVQSYFDGNITVKQNLLDIEGDFVSIEIGKWRIVNQTVTTVVFQTQETSAVIGRSTQISSNDDTVCSLDYTLDMSATSSFAMTYAADDHNLVLDAAGTVQHDSPTAATGMSALQWLQDTVMIPQATTLQWMQETTMVPASSILQWLQETMMIPQATTLQWMQETTMVPAAGVLQWLQATVMVPSADVLQWLQATTMVLPAGVLEWLQATTMVPLASVNNWLQETTMVLPASQHDLLQETTMVLPASQHDLLQETTMVPRASSNNLLQETTMILPASQHDLLQETTMVTRASSNNLLQETTMVLPASQHDLLQETTMVPAASHMELTQATTKTPNASQHDLLQETTMVPAASHMELTQATTKTPNASQHSLTQDTAFTIRSSQHDLLQETAMVPTASQHSLTQDTAFAIRSSQHSLTQDTAFAIRSSQHDLLQETAMVPTASQHMLTHNSEYNILASNKQLYQVGELLPRSLNVSVERLLKSTPRMAPAELNNLTDLQLPMSPIDIEHLSIKEIYLNAPSIDHKVYMDSLYMPWNREILAKPIEHPSLPNVYSKYFVIDTNSYGFNAAQHRDMNSHLEYTRSFFAPELVIDTIPGFVGERYTPVNCIFDRSLDGKQSLILIPADRNPYENYDYGSTPFIREYTSLTYKNTNPNREPALGYIPLSEQFAYETPGDSSHVRTFARESYHGIELNTNYSIAENLGDRSIHSDYSIAENLGDRSIHSDYSIAENLGDRPIHSDYSITENKQELQLVVDYARSAVANKTLLVIDYIPNDLKQITLVDLNYDLELLKDKKLAIDYEPVQDTLSFQVKPEYQQVINTLSFQVKPEYQQVINTLSFQVKADYEPSIDHLSFQVKADYEPSIDHLSFQVKADYEQLLDHLSFQVKADYEQDLPVSVYGNATKLTYQVDPELLWKQDLSTDYFVFNTAQDALNKALSDGYANYAAYQVYDTPYYSYRILIDTALVCKLPKGRYPIAWLLHGG